jgi:hypothetical protein
MKSQRGRSVTLLGVGVMALGLMGVWLFPHRPANGTAEARMDESEGVRVEAETLRAEFTQPPFPSC